ncbi:phenylalanine--tRNA ligase subunit beta [Macrococcus armenti]|uniref:phenylalanine--tRNA ligase subunit beta n=1 Tax=Macrococcus armenti TaxID=2875764 RepID=UPI001CCD2051|nr:phenylalanine--tRNA ligase subunit beta [Macrococcus armenti]UBH10134.1 phenylalanine--tRNA ligase subunit beta [Macrococcus armenti]UBH14621.1 phenylalanine--tRNA ligase subunit beta [Macrococcus armenti]UBH16981.1 phenylalanine--tRNA ligase subunit beta [Macrococcus armenti]UBH19245.1 phenylalanine--tRNA ligase subunit beta [Macrococcus armenti]
MLVSKEWLDDYVKVDVPVETLAEKITRSGIEIEEIIDFTKDIKNLVVGYVESIEKHPDADKLNVCQVNVGDEVKQIVCGAPNVAAGQTVIVCLPGGRLPGGIKIKKAKLRGVESNGMICSLGELGIASNLIPEVYENGIYVFEERITPGSDALTALSLNDAVMEFGLTPNRSDCMSMVGSAFETSALYESPLKLPSTQLNETDEKAQNFIDIQIDNTELVPYYAARIVKNVKIGPSPAHIQGRLIKAGIRPINNVVDVSNYVMLEYGQPLHMFDYDKIGSTTIKVRTAADGEMMTTLDDKSRTLTNEDIVITNGSEPIALAGVMGGDFSEVTDSTVNVLIESAMFAPLNIRKTANRLNLRSESSSRFEKGVAAEFVLEAIDRAAYLLQENAQGEVMSGVVSAGALPDFTTSIQISTDDINQLIGFNISNTEIKNIFERLGFETKVDGDAFNVIVPSRRGDITIKEDLVEEVARIYGYDALPATLPETKTNKQVGLTDYQTKRRAVKALLQGLGFNQAITYALVSAEKSTQFALKSADTTALLMPMSEDHAVLRQSLLPHLIDVVSYNNARQMKDVAFYEIGNTFFKQDGLLPSEEEHVAGIITGLVTPSMHQGKKEQVDFFHVKGIVEAISARLGLTFNYVRSSESLLHPGRSADIFVNEMKVGIIGQLHPTVEKYNDLKETYVFELDLKALLSEHQGQIIYNIIPKFPGTSRDIALEVERKLDTGTLIDEIMTVDSKYLKSAEVFDVYEGEHIADDKKSVAIRMEFLNPEQTLTDEEIKPIYEAVIEKLQANGAKLRG